jgi:hypothetical protein
MANGGINEMKVQQTNPAILRKLGLEALCKSLGPVGMVRFLQQYEKRALVITPKKEISG